MTKKEKFIALMKKRNYIVQDMGKMVFLSCEDSTYRAIHFFNADGSRDETKEVFWTM